MINFRRIPVCLLIVTALFFAAASAQGGGIMLQNKVPGQVEGKTLRLMHHLQKEGFEVSRGYFKLWTADDCTYTDYRMGFCFGNNPAAPYVITTLPPWPEEFVDPWLGNIFGPSIEGYNDIYRFDPREAIVILAKLPPPGSYFSEQTWLFTRVGTFDPESTRYKDIANDENLAPFIGFFFSTVPDHPERIQALSSLSNIVNNVVIERQSGSAFDQIRYFIITPDGFMESAVRNAFAGISVRDEDVFTERIPSDMKVGLGEASDDFTTWMRYAHPDNDVAAGKWKSELPMVVLRVRDTRSTRPIEPYPPVVLEERTANDETGFKDDLGNLLYQVSQRWGQPCVDTHCSDRAMTFSDLQTYPTFIVGPLCIAAPGENCLLDNQDTFYQLYGPLSLDNGEIYAVAGTLGTETGNATYVGLGINQVSVLKGVANLSNDDLKGSANGYAGKVGNTDKFYLYYFTRDCAGLEDLTDDNCKSLKTLIPPRDYVAFSLRDYIKPRTQRGPDSSLILPSKVLLLQRP